MKSTFFLTTAFAALTLAAPLAKRQCMIDECGVQTCNDTPTCTTYEDGSVACVAKRSLPATNIVVKRQCYIDEAGAQSCLDTPVCRENEDGSVICVGKRSEEGLMKRQCYIDEQGVQHCVDTTPGCPPKDGGETPPPSYEEPSTYEEPPKSEEPSGDEQPPTTEQPPSYPVKREAKNNGMTRRACYFDDQGQQHCSTTSNCTTRDDGSVVCVGKREAEAEVESDLMKRQCYFDAQGKQHCNDKPRCTKRPDGSVVCVSK
ncbi:hypothetical protein TI39_contig392g00031 [Zymoseptoria brevis]|uniref:Uncharacterized protein n=1 Tax=Zymoseptoria brevis TaxID=1047168 RepID=A0A0F4GNE4_9PEZI|nr:hypothetical protein TI39_contig392g00031 [Zymoseptoria brevis]